MAVLEIAEMAFAFLFLMVRTAVNVTVGFRFGWDMLYIVRFTGMAIAQLVEHEPTPRFFGA